jgi:hypothetical protein
MIIEHSSHVEILSFGLEFMKKNHNFLAHPVYKFCGIDLSYIYFIVKYENISFYENEPLAIKVVRVIQVPNEITIYIANIIVLIFNI